jgi:hypothetical protein
MGQKDFGGDDDLRLHVFSLITASLRSIRRLIWLAHQEMSILDE